MIDNCSFSRLSLVSLSLSGSAQPLTVQNSRMTQLIIQYCFFNGTLVSTTNTTVTTLGATTDSSLNYAVYWYNSRAIGGSTVQYIGNSINSTVTYSGRDSYAISFDGSTIEGSQLVLSSNVLYSKSSSGTAYAIYMPAASVKLGSTLSVGYNEVYGYVMFNVANHAGPLQLRNLLWSKIDVLIYGPVNSEIVIDNCSFSRLSLVSLSLSGSAQPLTVQNSRMTQLIIQYCFFNGTLVSTTNTTVTTLGATTDSSLNYAVYWYNSRAIGGSTVQYIGNSINSTVTYSGRDSYAISFDGSTIEGSQLVLSSNVLYSKSSSGTAYAIYMPAASVKLGSTLSVGYNEVYGNVMFNVANHAGPLQLRNLFWSKIDVLIYGPVNSEIVIDNCSFSRLSLVSLSLSGSAQPLTVQNSRMTQLIIQYCFFNGTLVSTTNTTVTTLGATTDSSLNYAVYWYNSRAIGGSTVQYIGNSINSTVTYSGRDSYAISFDGSTIEGSQLVLSNNVLYSKSSSSGNPYAIYMPALCLKLGSTLNFENNGVYGNVMFNVANHAGPLQLRNLFWSNIDVLIYGPVNSEIVIDNCSFVRLTLSSFSLSGSAQPLTIANCQMTQLILQNGLISSGARLNLTNNVISTFTTGTAASLMYAVYWLQTRVLNGSIVHYHANTINATVTRSGYNCYAIMHDTNSYVQGSQYIMTENVLYAVSPSGGYVIYMTSSTTGLTGGSTLLFDATNQVTGGVFLYIANHGSPLYISGMQWPATEFTLYGPVNNLLSFDNCSFKRLYFSALSIASASQPLLIQNVQVALDISLVSFTVSGTNTAAVVQDSQMTQLILQNGLISSGARLNLTNNVISTFTTGTTASLMYAVYWLQTRVLNGSIVHYHANTINATVTRSGYNCYAIMHDTSSYVQGSQYIMTENVLYAVSPSGGFVIYMTSATTGLMGGSTLLFSTTNQVTGAVFLYIANHGSPLCFSGMQLPATEFTLYGPVNNLLSFDNCSFKRLYFSALSITSASQPLLIQNVQVALDISLFSFTVTGTNTAAVVQDSQMTQLILQNGLISSGARLNLTNNVISTFTTGTAASLMYAVYWLQTRVLNGSIVHYHANTINATVTRSGYNCYAIMHDTSSYVQGSQYIMTENVLYAVSPSGGFVIYMTSATTGLTGGSTLLFSTTNQVTGGVFLYIADYGSPLYIRGMQLPATEFTLYGPVNNLLSFDNCSFKRLYLSALSITSASQPLLIQNVQVALDISLFSFTVTGTNTAAVVQDSQMTQLILASSQAVHASTL